MYQQRKAFLYSAMILHSMHYVTYYLRYHGYKQIFTLHKKHGVKSKPVHTLNIAHVAFAAVGTKHFTMGVARLGATLFAAM